jgi:hypothetical protein
LREIKLRSIKEFKDLDSNELGILKQLKHLSSVVFTIANFQLKQLCRSTQFLSEVTFFDNFGAVGVNLLNKNLNSGGAVLSIGTKFSWIP